MTMRMTLLLAVLACGCSSEVPSQLELVDAGTVEVGIDGASEQGTSEAGTDSLTEPEGSVEQDAEAEAAAPCAPAKAGPELGPGGYGLDGWQWTRKGVVLEDSTAPAQGGYIAPAAVVVGDTLHLWVTRKDGTQHRIHHSTSTDGASFAPLVPTSGLAGENIIAYPSVLHDGAGYLMWYGSGTIDFAQSQDGVSWTMKAESVLKPGEAGQFDSISLLYPSVVRTSSGYVMYYTGYNGAAFGIGRAESSDGVSWTKSPQGAVVEKGTALEFDNHAAAQPCAVAAGQGVLLWYGGYDTSKANPGPYRVGLAQSQDGKTFDKRGVTLDLEASGDEAWSTRDPAAVRWQDRWWMAYVAMGTDARYRIAVATSETCAPW
jgi:predicted GH43/DUF377 family glycosyl hydrolase